MALLVGLIIALAVGVLGTTACLDRDRSFYPVIAIVVASYYALFATIGGPTETLVIESSIGIGFAALAVVGYKSSLWLAMVALAGHGVFDLLHGLFIANPGMPIWWPTFCATFDVLLGGYMAWQLKTGKIRR